MLRGIGFSAKILDRGLNRRARREIRTGWAAMGFAVSGLPHGFFFGCRRRSASDFGPMRNGCGESAVPAGVLSCSPASEPRISWLGKNAARPSPVFRTRYAGAGDQADCQTDVRPPYSSISRSASSGMPCAAPARICSTGLRMPDVSGRPGSTRNTGTSGRMYRTRDAAG